MRQIFPLKKQDPEREDMRSTASFSGQSIDEWLAAAVAEQANRTAARSAAIKGPATAAAPAPDPVEIPSPSEPTELAPAAPPPVGDNLAVATAAKTAAALGSVTSWIERAQEQLTSATRASSEAQMRTEAAVTNAIGALGKRLEEIERKVENSGPADAAEPRGAARDPEGASSRSAAQEETAGEPNGAFKGLESRIRNIAGRVGPSGGGLARRGLTPRDEIEAAVTEIRYRQADLERTIHPEPERVAESAPASQGEASFLTALRAEVDRLSRVDVPSEPRFDGAEVLRQEIDDLHGSVRALATRDQIGAIERSISGLAVDVAEVRQHGGDVGSLKGDLESLHLEIQHLADVRAPAEQLGKISRDIDVLSHKLDMVAASGTDPALIDSLNKEVGEIRGMLAGSAAPQDISALDEQLSEIRRDISKIGARQVDPREFTSLRIAVEEMRQTLARPFAGQGPAESGFGEAQSALQQIAQEELQPIVTLMAELGQRFDRLERSIADTGALGQIEKQIGALAAAIGSGTVADPALASLHQGLTDLMGEVANWREGTIEIAERAARKVARETLGGWADDPKSPEPISAFDRSSDRGNAIDERARDSLETVHTRLEDVVRRIGRLDTSSAGQGDERSGQPASLGQSAPASRVIPRDDADIVRFDPAPHHALAEADRPMPASAADRDEILLEPGAERPRAGSIFAEPTPDSADIKASFIAAARRAAQAASVDANRVKGSRFSDAITAAGAGPAPGLSSRIRGALDRFRRPLLIGAAALALAIGGFRLISDLPGGSSSKVASTPAAPVISAPARSSAVPAARQDGPEPQTTQALPSPDRDVLARQATLAASSALEGASAAASDVQVASPPAIADVAKATAAIPPVETPKVDAAAKPKVEASLSAPAQPLPPASPGVPEPATASGLNGLKQAAASGDATAMYELGARTAEGRGVAKDLRAAATLFERAADKNFAPAQYRTGNIYEKGIGVARDMDAARKWYARAAEGGNTRAMHNLAVLIAEGGGGKPDYATALTWFQKASEYGVRDSQFNLGVLSARGLGGPQDLVKSYTWFAVAAGQGDDEAGRKRDEVAARLSPADLAKAKTAVERWRPLPANPAANEIIVPVGGWTAVEPPAKRAGR